MDTDYLTSYFASDGLYIKKADIVENRVSTIGEDEETYVRFDMVERLEFDNKNRSVKIWFDVENDLYLTAKEFWI